MGANMLRLEVKESSYRGGNFKSLFSLGLCENRVPAMERGDREITMSILLTDDTALESSRQLDNIQIHALLLSNDVYEGWRCERER